jgi:hypothetical protein
MTFLQVARRPGNDLLFSLWLALVAAGLVLHFLADVFQQRHPGFPLLPVLISAGASFAGAHCLTIAIARKSVPGFAVYQPFVGGDRYIVLQAIGYLGLVFGGAISSFYFVYAFGGGRMMLIRSLAEPLRGLSSPAAGSPFYYGLLSAGGIISSTGSFILLQSMQSFRDPRFAPDGSQRSLLKRLSTPPTRETALVLMVTGANFIVCLTGGMVRELSFLCLSVYLFIHLACGFAVHGVIGWRHTPGYRLFNPFPAGGWAAALAQFFSWLLFSVAVEGGVLLMQPGAPLVAYVALASIGVLSVTSLLLFVRTRFFSAGYTKRGADDSGSQSSLSFAAHHGPFVLSITNGLVSLFMWSVSALQVLSPFEGVDIAPLSEGLAVCRAVTAVLMLGLPPLTHLAGSIKFPEHYDAWQPFQGPVEFILLQAIGWAFYTIAIVTGIMAVSGEPVFLDVYALAVLLSQLFVHSSVSVFRPGPTAASERRHQLSPSRMPTNSLRRGDAAAAASTPARLVFNGEMITAVLLVVSSIIFRIICDVTPRGAEMPVTVLVTSATAMWAIAAPLAHISGRDKGIPIFQPFSGPAEYVAMQAVGWTLYAIVLLLQVISAFEGSKDFTPLMYTMEGVVAALPFTMIAASVYFGFRKVTEQDAVPFLQLPEPMAVRRDDAASTPRKVCPTTNSPEKAIKNNAAQPQPSAADVAELHRLVSSASSPWVAQHLRSLLDDAVFASHAPLDGTPPQLSAIRESIASPNEHARSSSDSHDAAKSRAYGAARATIFVMCATSTTLFFLAADFSTVDRRRTALILAAAGCFCTTMASVGVHLVLGPLMNGAGYRAFMPFEGGFAFVAMQACGWSAYTVMLVLYLLYALELTSALAPLLVAGCLGALSQVLILLSTRRFSKKMTQDDPPTLLESHAEGAVAFLMFMGTFTFFHSYESFAAGKSSVSPFPIVCSCTCLVMAIPLTVRSLRKSTELWSVQEQLSSTPLQTPSKGRPNFSKAAHLPADTSPALTSRRGGMWDKNSGRVMLVRSVVTPPLMILEYFIFAALSMLPFCALYAAYYISNDYLRYAGLFLVSSKLLLPGIAVSLLLTLISRSAPQLTPRWFVRFRVATTTCVMYMIPTIIFVPTYVIGPFFYPTNGTYLWAFCVSWYVCVPPPWNRVVFRPINAGAIAWFLYSRWIVNAADPTNASEWIVTVVDMSIVVFWYKYNGRYAGKPEERGRFRSPRFIQFMKTWFFDDAAAYFNLRVVADPQMKGKLADPKNQFIFGFHPHGVFPATAMYGPHTEAWKRELGWNPTSYPVGHAATVLLNGPLVRDFVMALGARVVTRAGIDASIEDGHSPVIVTGGQSELIITRHSHSEMHIVTHHHGFVKIAVRHRLPLVPMLSLGEQNVMDIVHLYRIQRLALKIVGFPAPFCPTGKWHLPLPNQTNLTLVVGPPLYPDADLSLDDTEGIQRFARRYFDSVKALFYEHRAAAGYPNMELFLHHGLPKSLPQRLCVPAASDPAVRDTANATTPAAGPSKAHTKKKTGGAVAQDRTKS